MAHILVIDDDDSVRNVTAALLRDGSHHVTEARSGGEAIALRSTHRPDLVITDLDMPVQNGAETIRLLRSQTPELPIIAMSGAPDSDLFRRAVELIGTNRTLTKPFRRNRLLALVDETIAATRCVA
jgi:CheY-like chemotaxis protein